LFCFWNVENLFDDRPNPKLTGVDREYDKWFAEDKEALGQKLNKVCQVLLEMNGGKGPDVIALAEVESYHAADLLRQGLNKQRLKNRAPTYDAVVYKDPAGGRSIATALITRLKVRGDRTRLLGKRQRVLKAHVEANGHELVVVVSHWTSRVSDKAGRG